MRVLWGSTLTWGLVQHVKIGELVFVAEVSKEMAADTIGLNFVQRENLSVHIGEPM